MILSSGQGLRRDVGDLAMAAMAAVAKKIVLVALPSLSDQKATSRRLEVGCFCICRDYSGHFRTELLLLEAHPCMKLVGMQPIVVSTFPRHRRNQVFLPSLFLSAHL